MFAERNKQIGGDDNDDKKALGKEACEKVAEELLTAVKKGKEEDTVKGEKADQCEKLIDRAVEQLQVNKAKALACVAVKKGKVEDTVKGEKADQCEKLIDRAVEQLQVNKALACVAVKGGKTEVDKAGDKGDVKAGDKGDVKAGV